MKLSIRDAENRDLADILRITNHAIAETTALWVDDPQTPEGLREWLDARRAAGMPILVADDGGSVCGFGSLGPFRPYPGFRETVEHSLYVDPAAQRRGVGRALLSELECRARHLGLHVMIGAIAADNIASLALHRGAGFREVGRLPEVGVKFGRRLDLVLMQKML